MAVPFPVYGIYDTYWKVCIGLLLHNIINVLPPALDFVSVLEGGDMDKDHVSYPQGHCFVTFIITFMAPHLLLLK